MTEPHRPNLTSDELRTLLEVHRWTDIGHIADPDAPPECVDPVPTYLLAGSLAGQIDRHDIDRAVGHLVDANLLDWNGPAGPEWRTGRWVVSRTGRVVESTMFHTAPPDHTPGFGVTVQQADGTVARHWACVTSKTPNAVCLTGAGRDFARSAPKKEEEHLAWPVRVVALIAKHPRWSAKRYADCVGVKRTTLYSHPVVREHLRDRKKHSIPKGEKSADGTITIEIDAPE